MKYIFILLIGCSPVKEPTFCFTCQETNYAEYKGGAVVGDAFTEFCDKTELQIREIEESSFSKVIDTVKLTHIVKCVRKHG